jgi:serine protease Do
MSGLAALVLVAQVAAPRPSLAPAVPRMSAPVVHIRASRRQLATSLPLVRNLLPARTLNAVGSGVIIDGKGVVLTNDHIVDGADTVVVSLGDEELPARVIGRDQPLDIALVSIHAGRPLPSAPLGRSSRVRVGDYVVAIGNPFGLDHTVTSGIISARQRLLDGQQPIPLLQTDASINPGNSGGPLYDLEGRVIGLNTAVVEGAHGIGFAIPIDLIRRALPQLVHHGRVTRGFLGVRVGELTPSAARALGVRHSTGAIVAGVVPGGPGARAGLEPGDLIVRWDGERVESSQTLPTQIALTPPDTRVQVQLVRRGEPLAVQVRMGALRPDADVP